MKDILSLIPYELNDYVKSLIKGQDLIIKTVPKIPKVIIMYRIKTIIKPPALSA